jgi:PAS domain S-box-containing protein
MSTSKPIPSHLHWLFAAIAVVIVVTWLAAWQYVQQSLIRTAGQALSLGASEIASKFDRVIFERYDDLRVMAVAFSSRMKDDPAFVQHYLDTVRETYETYHWVAAADAQGRLVSSTSAEMPRGADVSQTPWFQEIRARAVAGPDATLLGEVDAFPTEEGAPDTIALSRAIYDSRGAFAGVVTSRIALSDLEAIAVETLPRLRHRNSMLTDIEYQIIAEDGVAYVDSDLAHKGRSNFSVMKVRSLEMAREGLAGYIEEMNQRRQIPVITGYSFTRQGPGKPDAFRWTVLMSIPTGSLVQPLQRFYLKVGAVGFAIVVPIFYLLIWMQKRWRKEWQLGQAERLRATTAEAQYHLLLQTTDQGIFGVDHNGRCTFINRSAAQMLGYTPHDLLGHSLHDLVHPGGKAPCDDRCVLVGALSQRNSTPLAEQVFRRKDGTVLDVECSAFPLTEDSRTTDFVFTFMDITERKQRTKELLQYQGCLQSLAAQLCKADEMARQRLASELHDNLAQTLALCQMKLMALSRTTTPPLAADIAPVTDLLNEAMTVTRQLMRDLRPPTLGGDGDLITAVQWVKAKLERHGLAVRVVDDGKRKLIDADVLRVAYQSLHELLFNVLKHAHVSEAMVRLRRIENYLAIQVKDYGAGFQKEATKVPTHEGGFGLFNLHEQLRSIGGHIRVSSVPGRGTRVTILLPLQTHSVVTPAGHQVDRTATTAAPGTSEVHPEQIRILLVDDHQIMRQGLRSMLESEPGFEVAAEAVDGTMAVDLAASIHPDVILMDINLPKLNGVGATRFIKDRFPDIAVIGLSMHEDPKLEQLMYEVGASAYFSKGTAFSIVSDTIRQVRQRTPHREALSGQLTPLPESGGG